MTQQLNIPGTSGERPAPPQEFTIRQRSRRRKKRPVTERDKARHAAMMARAKEGTVVVPEVAPTVLPPATPPELAPIVVPPDLPDLDTSERVPGFPARGVPPVPALADVLDVPEAELDEDDDQGEPDPSPAPVAETEPAPELVEPMEVTPAPAPEELPLPVSSVDRFREKLESLATEAEQSLEASASLPTRAARLKLDLEPISRVQEVAAVTVDGKYGPQTAGVLKWALGRKPPPHYYSAKLPIKNYTPRSV